MFKRRKKKVTDYTKELLKIEVQDKMAEARLAIKELNCKIDCYFTEHIKDKNEVATN